MTRTSPPARPRLEALEDRWCPAAFAEGDTLHIWGSSGDDGVTVTQQDDPGYLFGNSILVKLNGVTTGYTSSAIRNIDVQLGEGNDWLIWRLNGSSLKYDKQANISLGDGANYSSLELHNQVLKGSLDIIVTGGAQRDFVHAFFGRKENGHLNYTANLAGGDDSCLAHMWGPLVNAYVQFELNGGDGDDFIESFADHDEIRKKFDVVNLDSASTFGVVMNGGNGNDHLFLRYSGVMDGLMVLRLDGGAHQDDVSAEVTMQGGSDGDFDGRLLGGSGGDDMYFKLKEEPGSNATILQALLDGGSGWFNFYDHSKTTGNVAVVNCI